jgi:predicted ATPase
MRRPIIGRQDELDAVDALLRDARVGHHAFVFEGDAGIGKTRLLDEALENAVTQGFRLLVAVECLQCQEGRRRRRLRLCRRQAGAAVAGPAC